MMEAVPMSSDERKAHAEAVYQALQCRVAQNAAKILSMNILSILGVRRATREQEKLLTFALSQFGITIGTVARLDALGIDEEMARASDEEIAEMERRVRRELPNVNPRVIREPRRGE